MKTKLPKRKVARKVSDAETEAIYAALKARFPNLSEKKTDVVYKYARYAIRICLIDEAFTDKSLAEREGIVMRALKPVELETRKNISMILMNSPDEMEDPDLMTQEFHDPDGSRL